MTWHWVPHAGSPLFLPLGRDVRRHQHVHASTTDPLLLGPAACGGMLTSKLWWMLGPIAGGTGSSGFERSFLSWVLGLSIDRDKRG
jgi:hypothetical protein